MITKQQLFDACHEALDALVDNYNAENESQVDVSVDGDVITVDGGGVHGAFDVKVEIEEI